jgi:PEP-CTERM motif
MRIFGGVLAGIGLLALAMPAQAGITYTNYSVLNNQTVTVNFSNGTTETGGAGLITLHGVVQDGTGVGDLSVWCVDLFDNLASSGSFTTQTPYAFDNAIYGKVDALISNGTPLLGNYNASAALQIAIWTELFGSIATISAPSDVEALAATYVADVTNGTWAADPYTALIELTGTGNQSQAFLSNVPEPVSMAMLGTGLAGIIVARRRKSPRLSNATFA